MLIINVFFKQMNSFVFDKSKENSIFKTCIPPSLNSPLQPLELMVNKVKAYVKRRFYQMVQ